EACLDKGVRKLCIQTDSRAAVAILQNSASRFHRHSSLVEQYHDLRRREWEVSIHHIFREPNNAADFLDNYGHQLVVGLHVFSAPVESLLYWLRHDCIDVCLPCLVNNNS
ncbi:Putative ribonuclease H protein At1g65750, partial [Linum perenne]